MGAVDGVAGLLAQKPPGLLHHVVVPPQAEENLDPFPLQQRVSGQGRLRRFQNGEGLVVTVGVLGQEGCPGGEALRRDLRTTPPFGDGLKTDVPRGRGRRIEAVDLGVAHPRRLDGAPDGGRRVAQGSQIADSHLGLGIVQDGEQTFELVDGLQVDGPPGEHKVGGMVAAGVARLCAQGVAGLDRKAQVEPFHLPHEAEPV